MPHPNLTKGNAPAASTVEASKAETPQPSKESTVNSTDINTSAQLTPSLTIENGDLTFAINEFQALAGAFRSSFAQDDDLAFSSMEQVDVVRRTGLIHEHLGVDIAGDLLNAVTWACAANLRLRGPRANSSTGAVYFVRNESTKQIKIGFTSVALQARLDQFKKMTGAECNIIAFIGANISYEAELHRKFKHLRGVGEWFNPGQDLLDFIAANAVEVTK